MIWLNGKFTTQAVMNIHDRGFLLGDGIFETMLGDKGSAVRLDKHFARLSHSLQQLNIPLPFDKKTVDMSIKRLLIAENISERAVIRLSVSRGIGRGLSYAPHIQPQWVMSVQTAPIPLRKMSVIVSDIIRPSTNMTSRMKTLGYLDNVLARQQAERVNADEALICNEKNHVVCAASGNLFIIDERDIYTPPLSDGVLPGIIRDVIICQARKYGFDIHEKTIKMADLYCVHHMFITNSLITAVPIISVNERMLTISPMMQDIHDMIQS